MVPRVHVFATTALGRRRLASIMLSHLYPGKTPVLSLEEAEWNLGSVWTRRSEENLYPSARARTRTVQFVAKHLVA